MTSGICCWGCVPGCPGVPAALHPLLFSISRKALCCSQRGEAVKLCNSLEKFTASELCAGRGRGWDAVSAPGSRKYLQSSRLCPRCYSASPWTWLLSHHRQIFHFSVEIELAKQKQIMLASRSRKLFLLRCLPSCIFKKSSTPGQRKFSLIQASLTSYNCFVLWKERHVQTIVYSCFRSQGTEFASSNRWRLLAHPSVL